jgi:hypothetical protein
MRRTLFGLASLGLLLLAAIRIPTAPTGQGAVPMSKPGQEDLTLWANHNGVDGEFFVRMVEHGASVSGCTEILAGFSRAA